MKPAQEFLHLPPWERLRRQKGSTMRGRLFFFFSMTVLLVIGAFAGLLVCCGITGSGRDSVRQYLESETTHVIRALNRDMAELMKDGEYLAKALNDIPREEMNRESAMDVLASKGAEISASRVFLVLKEEMETPSDESFWRADAAYDTSEYTSIFSPDQQMKPLLQLLEVARENPDRSVAELSLWYRRPEAAGNPGEPLMLCVPLRRENGELWGVCGLELTEDTFARMYGPSGDDCGEIYSLLVPVEEGNLFLPQGLQGGSPESMAAMRPETLRREEPESEFDWQTSSGAMYSYEGSKRGYGGVMAEISMYPEGSVYGKENWAAGVLVLKSDLLTAVKGRTMYLYRVVLVMVGIGLIAAGLMARLYVQPIVRGLDTMRGRKKKQEAASSGVLEVDRLREEMSQDLKVHEEEVLQLRKEREDVEEQYHKVQVQIGHLADEKRQEMDPEEYQCFLENLQKLTATERKVFRLYLSGKTSKDILEVLQIKENTLKYHNRNLYSKLGVSSRKQLLRYGAVVKEQNPELVEDSGQKMKNHVEKNGLKVKK